MNITVSTPGAGIVAHYQFDGTTLNTSGGGAGTTTGSPAYEDAVFDRALAFDGVNDFVTMPANIVGMLTDATFAMRVRWRGGAAWQRVFDFGAGSAQYMIFTPSSGSGTAQFAILNSGGTTQRLAGPEPLPVGEWCHVAVTLIGNTGTLYVNGAAVAATSITLDPASIAQTANYLGDSQFTADPLFDGALDDLRIYNRGLSAAEVAALASPPPGMSVPLDDRLQFPRRTNRRARERRQRRVAQHLGVFPRHESAHTHHRAHRRASTRWPPCDHISAKHARQRRNGLRAGRRLSRWSVDGPRAQHQRRGIHRPRRRRVSHRIRQWHDAHCRVPRHAHHR
jgi:Concanavalin A-like lectin/glucanases superfamily